MCLLALLLFLAGAGLYFSRGMQQRVIKALEQRFDTRVELKELRVSLFPPLSLKGRGLVIYQKDRTDLPAFISIDSFTARAGILGLLADPKRVRDVRLEGLAINVPPRKHENREEEHKNGRRKEDREIFTFIIDDIVADGTSLTILPGKPGKEPLVFDISRLKINSAGMGSPMRFRATLTNPKPPGQIESSGEFGPWHAGDPGLTPVSGTYRFEKADLSVFDGIAGILSSEGKYNGVLERIDVQGQTDTPDFRVTLSNKPVHLTTEFSAVVDGTNGDTILQPVRAHFLHSTIVANGRVAGVPGVKGKAVVLDFAVERGRVEDLLRLAVKDQPPLKGAVSFKTKFNLPPGRQQIPDRLDLNSTFAITSAVFTSTNVQKKVVELSRRGKGEPEGSDDAESVVSNLKGQMVLDNGIARFSQLSFEVPGAAVALAGSYNLRSENLDFRGTVRLQAKLSETTTGVKSFFLKLVDPLFKGKHGGAVLPIKISGTRGQPHFGLDTGRILHH